MSLVQITGKDRYEVQNDKGKVCGWVSKISFESVVENKRIPNFFWLAKARGYHKDHQRCETAEEAEKFILDRAFRTSRSV
jgi:hypothetical protein